MTARGKAVREGLSDRPGSGARETVTVGNGPAFPAVPTNGMDTPPGGLGAGLSQLAAEEEAGPIPEGPRTPFSEVSSQELGSRVRGAGSGG